MKIEVKMKDDIKIIKLIGDLDGTTAEKAREKIMEQVEADSKYILDMQECEYVSSAGLRVLMIIAKKLKAVDSRGILANMVTAVKDVMEMTGFSHMLQSSDTIKEAVALHEEGRS